MKFSKKQSHTGFTLIETLVAIFIFSTALVALSTIAARGVGSVNRAKEVVTAQFLSQEGLEMIRNVRDNNTLTGNQWDSVFSACTPDAPCDISYLGGVPTLDPCLNVNGCNLWIENGIYTSTPDTPAFQTKFYRVIWTEPSTDLGSGVIEYIVRSRVTWTVGTGLRTVESATIITDWQ